MSEKTILYIQTAPKICTIYLIQVRKKSKKAKDVLQKSSYFIAATNALSCIHVPRSIHMVLNLLCSYQNIDMSFCIGCMSLIQFENSFQTKYNNLKLTG